MNKKWIFLISILTIILSAFVYFKFFDGKKSRVSYQRHTVKRGDLKVFVRASGTVQPQNRLEIKPPIAGRIESVLLEEGNTVSKGRILAWMSSTERAALLDAARAKGASELKEWEDLYKPTPVMAPLKGLVIANNIRTGQTVTQQDILFVLSDALLVQAKVDETDLARVKKGQKALLTIDSFPAEPVLGFVSHIAYEAVTENNVTVYSVEVKPSRVPEFFRSGMSSTVDFIFAEESNILLIPNESILKENGQSFVYTPNPEKESLPSKKKIEIGLSDEGFTQVKDGLSEGEIILIQKIAPKTKQPQSGGPFQSPRMPPRR
ncbi:RND transporter [Leptospira kobayashii]|uniref:RND transporter n=1 Tax=Leptospira kobayashii TaxID=1917830 RepID=A0ABM7UGA1_9LEPT|nr:HlyD family efflux transporter periplasmic adaptor subunit [Leptospira kobayashii]BDA77497.1 RND transporter [Leptospira kobayashii]